MSHPSLGPQGVLGWKRERIFSPKNLPKKVGTCPWQSSESTLCQMSEEIGILRPNLHSSRPSPRRPPPHTLAFCPRCAHALRPFARRPSVSRVVRLCPCLDRPTVEEATGAL